MLKIDLRDPNVTENFKAIQQLQKLGFSEEEIQEIYNRQAAKDIHNRHTAPQHNKKSKRAGLIIALKWALIIIGTFYLFRAGQAAAYAQRGYEAIGGEACILLIPLLWYCQERTIKDWIYIYKEGKSKKE